MNRADRRRAEREKQERYSPPVSSDIKNAVTLAVMNKRAREQALQDASGDVLRMLYAALILVMTDEYGFDHDQCVDLLTKLEDKTLLCISTQELVDEAFEKTGIRINYGSVVDRIEETI